MNRGCPRGTWLLPRTSTRRVTLAVLTQAAQRNTAKAGQTERSYREGHGLLAGVVKTFRRAGDVEKGTAGLRSKDSLRVKRRDPWRRANAPPKAVADPEPNGQDAKYRRRVLTWFASRWRNHQPKRAEKPHSKSCCRKARDGPATRPKTPLAVENSVGEPAAHVAPNAGTGKESVAHSHLPLWPVRVRPGRLLWFCRRKGRQFKTPRGRPALGATTE